jgi:putative acetyltransferase
MQRDSPDLAIRLAEAADVAAIEAVLAAAFADYQFAYTPEAFAATTPTAAQIQSRLDEGPVWVAVQENTMLGTVSAVPHGQGLYIRSMAVLPMARGQGIGVLLLQHLEDFALAQGYSYLFLSTTPFLTRAIRLYEQIGFSRSGDGPHDLYGTPLLTMLKPLGRSL